MDEELKCKLCGSTEDVSSQNFFRLGEGVEREVYCNDAVKCWGRVDKKELEVYMVKYREREAMQEITKLAGGK